MRAAAEPIISTLPPPYRATPGTGLSHGSGTHSSSRAFIRGHKALAQQAAQDTGPAQGFYTTNGAHSQGRAL